MKKLIVQLSYRSGNEAGKKKLLKLRPHIEALLRLQSAFEILESERNCSEALI